MDDSKNYKSLEVALLIDDINEAKEISKIFRQVNVVAHFYENLSSFWAGVLSSCPALAVVDVKLMCSTERNLLNHPLVSAKKLPLAFYYTESSRPLLQSTFGYTHLGLIKRQANYDNQLKSILKRANQLIELENSLSSLSMERDKLRKQLDEMITVHEKQREQDFFNTLLKNSIFEVEKICRSEDFYLGLSKSLSNNEFIKSYSILELNSSGQRLVAPKINDEKYVEIPSLWLGQTCKNGIEFFAQNLANQVAMDILGGGVVSLNIFGASTNPDLLVLVKSESENFIKRYDWEAYEGFLTGLYSNQKLKEKNNSNNQADYLNSWQFMSAIDRQFYLIDEENITVSEIDNSTTFLELDFSVLTKFILANQLNRFYWGRFYSDFVTKLKSSLPVGTKYSFYGSHKLFIICTNSVATEVFETLKILTGRFSYWRYFEDSDQVFTKKLSPKVKNTNYASIGLMRAFEKDSIEVFQNKHPSSSLSPRNNLEV